MVTSRVSFGSAGPISRAPANGTRLLPARGMHFFGAGIDVDILSVRLDEASKGVSEGYDGLHSIFNSDRSRIR
jgi:hypothetical protein